MTPTSTPPAFSRDQRGFSKSPVHPVKATPTVLRKGTDKERYRELVSRWDKVPKAKPGLLMREQMGWPATITK